MSKAGFTDGASGKTDKENAPFTSATKTKSSLKAKTRHAYWGSDDKLPITILDKIEQVPAAAAAIKYNAELLQSQGVMYVKKSDLASGRSNMIRHYDPEIESFLSRNSVETDLIPGKCFDIAGLFNGFSEAIFNFNRTKIVQLVHKEAEFCRISKYDKDKNLGDRQYLYYAADFAANKIKSDGDYDNPEKVTALQLYDPYNFNFFPELLKKKVGKFAIHSRPRTSRSFYYASIPWQGLYQENGWVDSAKNIPEIVNSMQNNQMRMMHIVYISVEYFEGVYGKAEWMAMEQKERDDKFEEVRKKIEERLIGSKNVGSSLTVMCEADFTTGNMRKNIIIEAVDNSKFKEGVWVPDADHAIKNILIGHSISSSQFGVTNSNTTMNSTSGSDTRQGFNTAVTMNTWLQKIVLYDLQLMADFNTMMGYKNWDVQFFIDDITHTTINQQESGIVPTEKPQ
jgi:hypothetical protein